MSDTKIINVIDASQYFSEYLFNQYKDFLPITTDNIFFGEFIVIKDNLDYPHARGNAPLLDTLGLTIVNVLNSECTNVIIHVVSAGIDDCSYRYTNCCIDDLLTVIGNICNLTLVFHHAPRDCIVNMTNINVRRLMSANNNAVINEHHSTPLSTTTLETSP